MSIDPENIPSYLKMLGKSLESRLESAVNNDKSKKEASETQPATRSAGQREQSLYETRNGMTEFEPDWDELDRKANMIVARYAVVSAAWNILPPPLDMMAVTGTFAKMATELAGVYQVIVSNKRAKEMGWAIATTTASVLGVMYAGSRLIKLIPGVSYLFGSLLLAPIMAAVAWAAGDTLKDYFKQSRQGREPSVQALSDSFAKTLRIKLKTVKIDKVEEPEKVSTNGTTVATTTTVPAAPKESVSDAIDKIASLHELMRAGAITAEEFEAKKADLLSRI